MYTPLLLLLTGGSRVSWHSSEKCKNPGFNTLLSIPFSIAFSHYLSSLPTYWHSVSVRACMKSHGLVMTRYIKNIDISFSTSIYYIVSYRHTMSIFDISRIK